MGNKPPVASSVADDPYQLERFVSAQRGTYDVALDELRRGAKRSHWIWFIFPQVAGLGSSAMAARYAIKSRREAKAYLAHSLLGARLMECANALLRVEGKTAEEIMGHPDDAKLRSSMTLFAAISAFDSPFHAVLDRYFSGEIDFRTIEYLGAHESE
jgi:uncharacterized protein (DUF1810 family)